MEFTEPCLYWLRYQIKNNLPDSICLQSTLYVRDNGGLQVKSYPREKWQVFLPGDVFV